MAKSDTERVYCNTCSGYTNHQPVGSYDTHWDDEDVGISGGGTHTLFKCAGCETPSLRSVSWFSEEPGGQSCTFQPARTNGPTDRKPKQLNNIPWGTPLDTAYRQTVSAVNQQLLILAGAGVRLVIEGVCRERGVEDGPVARAGGEVIRMDNLQGKIHGLAEKNFISTQQAEYLHEIRFLGNDSAHELHQPSASTLAAALDIVEHLLEQVYEQPEKAKTLNERRRPKK